MSETNLHPFGANPDVAVKVEKFLAEHPDVVACPLPDGISKDGGDLQTPTIGYSVETRPARVVLKTKKVLPTHLSFVMETNTASLGPKIVSLPLAIYGYQLSGSRNGNPASFVAFLETKVKA